MATPAASLCRVSPDYKATVLRIGDRNDYAAAPFWQYGANECAEDGTMSGGVFLFADRRSSLAFWIGSAVVSIGVVLHLPMFWMARHSGFILAGMPMDAGMLLGMGLIIGGIAATAYGLLPNKSLAPAADEFLAPPEDAPFTHAPWRLMAVLAGAPVVDPT